MRSTYLFFSLLLCITSYAQPNPLNRRAMAIAGLAQGPFNIDNSPGLVLHFQADKGVRDSSGGSPPSSGTTVSWWTNQIDISGLITGNGNMTTNTGFALASKLFYYTGGPNGNPFLSFTNGTSTLLQPKSSPTFNWPDTVFIVLKRESGGINQLFFQGNTDTTRETLFFRTDDTLRVSTDGGTELNAGGPINGWFLVTVMFNTAGNTSIVRTNGVQAVTGTFTGGTGTYLFGTFGSHWDGTLQSKVSIAEVIYSTNNLNNVGSVGAYWLTNIENSLKTKYGL